MKYFTVALYLILFVCAVTFPIVFLNITPTPEILLIIMASGFVTSVIGCLIIMFYPKQKLLFDGVDVDNNLQLVRSSSTHASSGIRGRVLAKFVQRVESVKSRMSSESANGNNSKVGITDDDRKVNTPMSLKFEKSMDGNVILQSPTSTPQLRGSIRVRKVSSKQIASLVSVDERSEDISEAVTKFQEPS